jgi:hypothetical protein
MSRLRHSGAFPVQVHGFRALLENHAPKIKYLAAAANIHPLREPPRKSINMIRLSALYHP